MNLARRGILKLLGAAPAVVAAAPALATQAAGISVPGLMAGASGINSGIPINSAGPSPRKTLTTLASYVLDQDKNWRSRSREIHCVDPDIASMRLPLGTKCRMQAERNYEKIRQRESDWFMDVFKKEGQVHIW